MNDAARPARDILVIEAGKAEKNYWRDLWRYRELLGFLAWRDLKVRYQQTLLGAAWALLQPVITIVVFTFIFGRLAKMPSGRVPYVLVVLAGQMGWQLFAETVAGAATSLTGSAHLISKVYFPRIMIPLSTVAVALVDFVIVVGLFVALCLWFQSWPTARIFYLPVFIALALALAFGASLWLSALTVRYRDFRIVVPFLLQVGIFLTPVGFRTDLFPHWRTLLALNPMTGVVDGFRWCLLADSPVFYWPAFLGAVLAALILIVTGVWYFRRTERSFADVI